MPATRDDDVQLLIDDPDILDSVDYTAKAMGVSTSTVWNLIGAGELETCKVRNTRRVKRRSRRDYIARNTIAIAALEAPDAAA